MAKAKAKSKPKGEGKEEPRIRFKFSDTQRVFEIDPRDLTVEEKVMVEEFFDAPWNRAALEGWLDSIKGLVFFAYLARRRVEDNFTYQQALSFEAGLTEKAEEEEGERPTGGSKKSGSQS